MLRGARAPLPGAKVAEYSKLAIVYSCSCKASVIARTDGVLHATVLQATEREVFRAPKVLAAAHALRVGRGEEPASWRAARVVASSPRFNSR